VSLDLLCFAPHPDDAELSCGGWLALCATRRQRAGICDLTRGERASNGTPEGRKIEATRAAGILGLASRTNLALPDAGITVDDASVAAVIAEIRRERPRIVLAPWVEARHPDHARAGELVRRAVYLSGLSRYGSGVPHRPRLLHYGQRHELRPDLVVDITAVVQTKRDAIAAHSSQIGPGTPTLVNQPVGRDAWEVRDRYWGASIGVSHGEAYLLGTPVPVSDPLAHFLEHAATPALVPFR
jgi:bacillithiol biosynthesis deacetylase BshB1